jgi:hypothetical protein
MSDGNDDEVIARAIKNDGAHEDYFRSTRSERITNSNKQKHRKCSADYSNEKTETLISNSGSRDGCRGCRGSRYYKKNVGRYLSSPNSRGTINFNIQQSEKVTGPQHNTIRISDGNKEKNGNRGGARGREVVVEGAAEERATNTTAG